MFVQGPLLKTRFWEVTGQLDYPRAESREKVRGFPPADGPVRGKTALFAILAIWAQIGELLAPYWTQASEENRTPPSGGYLKRSLEGVLV